MIVSVCGTSTAEPMPCSTLAAISSPALPTSPHHTDAMVKIATPLANIVRAP
jgi:hypothetical protein